MDVSEQIWISVSAAGMVIILQAAFAIAAQTITQKELEQPKHIFKKSKPEAINLFGGIFIVLFAILAMAEVW